MIFADRKPDTNHDSRYASKVKAAEAGKNIWNDFGAIYLKQMALKMYTSV